MEKTGGSRLLQMQARFQQKQLQEREMKIASLYEAQQVRALDKVRYSPSNMSSASPPHAPQTHQPGKVRQMFEERRTKGIDKSYPLQPIHNTDRPAARKPLPNGYSKVTNTKTTVEKKSNKSHTQVTTHSIKRQNTHERISKTENLTNGSGDLNHNHQPDLNSIKRALPQSNGEVITSSDEVDKAQNNYLIEDETFPEALAPTPTPRSPDPPAEVKKLPPRRSPATRISPSKAKPQPTPAAPPQRRVANENNVTDKARGGMQRAANPVLKKQSVSTVPNGSPGGSKARSSSGSGAACSVCGRRFATDRVQKHEEICRKAHAKKRKPFDALKHRLAGTEAEPFITKLRKAPTKATATTTAAKPINSSWRQKHEEFIQAIRAAKQVQQHLAAGGKLSDLPPPPPSENPDYVACPHCARRFNQAAAERHIPKCANYQFNKPKPAAKRR